METSQQEEKLTYEKVWAMFQETDRQMKETDKQMKKTDRRLKNLSREIGGLGNKFGSYTEGLFFPSLSKILESKFNVTNISRNAKSKVGGKNIEIDVLGYNNGSLNTVYIVEVKSNLREKHIEQTLTIIEKFRTYFPEHKDKKIYGIIASIEYTDELKELVLASGLYFVKIHNEIFKLDSPEGFEAKEF